MVRWGRGAQDFYQPSSNDENVLDQNVIINSSLIPFFRFSLTNLEGKPEVGLLDIKPTHLFRYASEWDPREAGHTKGGYLEGRLALPTDQGNLKVVFSTVADFPLNIDPEISRKFPECTEIHPTLLYVVRKGKGNRRMTEREPVPNHHHWRQEFYIVDRCVRVRNRTSEADLARYDKIEKIPKLDDMFMLGSDMVLNIGKGTGELNLIILIPKTEARSLDKEVTINKIIADRVSDPEAMEAVLNNYKKKTATNIKKLKLKVEIFNLETNMLIHSAISPSICDTASKEHGAMDFAEASPLRGCSKGGRKVLMVAENQIAKDVEPVFLLYDQNGQRLEEMEDILTQPNDERFPDAKNVSVMKETIIFITPPQPNIEMVMRNGWTIKLAGLRKSDGFVSTKKFNFNYMPDDYYEPCIFCELRPDGYSGKVVLPNPIGPARPGVKKRRMPDSIRESFMQNQLLNISPPKFAFDKIACLDNSVPDCMPALDKLLVPPASHTAPPGLKLKPISALQQTYTTSQPDQLQLEQIKQESPYKELMPDLIELSHTKPYTISKDLEYKRPTPVVPLPPKIQTQEKLNNDPFRAALQKLVNKQNELIEPTELERLLLSPRETNKKSLPFLIKLEENAPQAPLLPTFPSLDKIKKNLQNPFVIKLESEEECMEPETTRPDLAPTDMPQDIQKIIHREKEPHALPKQKLEALLKSLERSSIEKQVGNFRDNHNILFQPSKPSHFRSSPQLSHLISSTNKVGSSTLSSSELDSLNNLDNIDLLDKVDNIDIMDKVDNIDILNKVFHPLPPSLSDKLTTNYNYASIGKKLL